jgi:hypothetical protein
MVTAIFEFGCPVLIHFWRQFPSKSAKLTFAIAPVKFDQCQVVPRLPPRGIPPVATGLVLLNWSVVGG